MSRVAAIGLDSAEWWFVSRLLALGHLPNLARFRSEAALVPLVNDIVGKPDEAWTGFLHGSRAQEAGYWSNLTFDPQSYRSYRQGAFLGDPFYSSLRAGRVLVFDVPKAIVSDRASGVQIVAWGAHAPSYPRSSRPAGLIEEIDRRFGVNPSFRNEFVNAWFQPDYVEQLGEACVEGVRVRGAATRWLLERFTEWDLFMVVMSEAHSAGHHFWHGVDGDHLLASAPTAAAAGQWMVKIHCAMDAALGEIIAALPPDAVIVVFSLHGMRANDSDVATHLLLPELLHRLHGRRPRLRGPDQRRWRRSGCPPIIPDPRRRPLAFARDHFEASPTRRLRRRLAAGPLLSAERRWRALRGKPPGHRPPWRTPADIAGETDVRRLDAAALEEPATDSPALWWQPGWPSMRAFALPSFGEGRVRINLVGRERDGIVDAGDYQRVCDEVETALRAARNPRTGDPVVLEVVRPRRHDPFDPLGPDADLLITWSTAVDALTHPDLGDIGPFPMMRTGEHSNAGFVFVAGPGIQPGLHPACSADILPELLLSLVETGDLGAALGRAVDVQH